MTPLDYTYLNIIGPSVSFGNIFNPSKVPGVRFIVWKPTLSDPKMASVKSGCR